MVQGYIAINKNKISKTNFEVMWRFTPPKNPQTTIVLTFLTHIIMFAIGGVRGFPMLHVDIVSNAGNIVIWDPLVPVPLENFVLSYGLAHIKPVDFLISNAL